MSVIIIQCEIISPFQMAAAAAAKKDECAAAAYAERDGEDSDL